MSRTLYKPLGDNDPKIRIEAAKQMAGELHTLLAGERTDDTRGQVDYALGRLTKGLSSGRESARPGFATVLTELTKELLSGSNSQKWGITFDTVLGLVLKHTHPSGTSMSRPEERGYHLGRLFGLKAMLESGVPTADVDALSRYTAALEPLIELWLAKPWMAEPCAWTVCTTIREAPKETVDEVVRKTYELLAAKNVARTSDGVGVWLECMARCPHVERPDVWKKTVPLAKGNLANLSKALRESGEKEEGADGKQVGNKGSWNPKLPFVWTTVADIYLQEEEEIYTPIRKEGIAEWSEFWITAVDEGLFAASASDERKFWGFSFFMETLEKVRTPAQLSPMFSHNFMRCLINQLSDPGRVLHKVALKTARRLIELAKTAPWIVPVCIPQLVLHNGSPNFDTLTKTKTVATLLLEADEAGLSDLVDFFTSVIRDPVPEEADADADQARAAEVRRRWAADQLVAVVRSNKSVKADDWLSKVVELFTAYGYFDVRDKKQRPAVPVSPASQEMFRARLQGTLTHLIGKSEGARWPCRAVMRIEELQAEEKKYALAIELDPAIAEAVRKAIKTLHRIQKKSSTDEQQQSFELLYALVILQIYNGEPDAMDLLEELQLIYRKLKSSADDDEDEIEPGAVLLEVLLSFMSKESKLFRTLARTVFTTFLDTIAVSGLEPLFDILETAEGLAGQNELFEQDDEADDDDGDDSDVEMVDGASADNSADELGSDVEELDVDEADDDDEAARQLDADLAAILQPSTKDGGDDGASDSGSSMDSEAMFALDDMISSKLRQYVQAQGKSKKTQKRDATTLIVTLKQRALDLLALLSKHAPASPLVLRAVAAAATLAHRTQDPRLASSAATIVRDAAAAAKKRGALPELPTPTLQDAAAETLKSLAQGAAGHSASKQAAAAASQAALLCVKALVAADPKWVARVAHVYAECVVSWATDPAYNPQPAFLVDALQWLALKKEGPRGKKRSREEAELDGEDEEEDGGKENGQVDKEDEEEEGVEKVNGEKAGKSKRKKRKPKYKKAKDKKGKGKGADKS